MKTSVVLLLLVVLVASASDINIQYVRKEVEWGKPINLEDFGGPHIEVFVRNREMTFVTAQTADYTKMVPIARTNIQAVEVNNYDNTATVYGSTGLDMQPTKNTRNVQKKNGIAFQGTNSTMYLLYQEPSSGIQVYFLDAISSQNHDSVVVAVRKSAPLQSPPQSAGPPRLPPSSTPAPDRQQSGQPISPELFTWYVALQKERETLDTSNPEAVIQFNLHAAAYHEALKKARSAQ